jgi:hypothetical protein
MAWTCPVCGTRGWLVVDVDSTGKLRIERCDECQRFTDADAQRLQAARDELARRLQKGRMALMPEGVINQRLINRFKEQYAAAVARLGPDLGGYSAFDLLCDQYPDLSTTSVRRLMAAAGIPDTKKEAA